MGLHIDHISLASPNIFKSADALCKETGLGYWTGEWLRDSAVHIVPLGTPGNFIEISGIVDVHSLKKMDERKQWMLDITETGDHFNGLCLGVDSMEELEQFAKHWNTTVNPSDNPDPAAHFQRASGLHSSHGFDAERQAQRVDGRACQMSTSIPIARTTPAVSRHIRAKAWCARRASSGSR